MANGDFLGVDLPTPRGADPLLTADIPGAITAGRERLAAGFEREETEPLKALQRFAQRVPLLGSQKDIDNAFRKFNENRRNQGLDSLEIKGFRKSKNGFVEILNEDDDEDDPGGSFFARPDAKDLRSFASTSVEKLPSKRLTSGLGRLIQDIENADNTEEIIDGLTAQDLLLQAYEKQLEGRVQSRTEKEKTVRAINAAIIKGDIVLARGMFALTGGLRDFKREGLKPLRSTQDRRLREKAELGKEVARLRRELEDEDDDTRRTTIKERITTVRGRNVKIDDELKEGRKDISDLEKINSFDQYVKFVVGSLEKGQPVGGEDEAPAKSRTGDVLDVGVPRKIEPTQATAAPEAVEPTAEGPRGVSQPAPPADDFLKLNNEQTRFLNQQQFFSFAPQIKAAMSKSGKIDLDKVARTLNFDINKFNDLFPKGSKVRKSLESTLKVMIRSRSNR